MFAIFPYYNRLCSIYPTVEVEFIPEIKYVFTDALFWLIF